MARRAYAPSPSSDRASETDEQIQYEAAFSDAMRETQAAEKRVKDDLENRTSRERELIKFCLNLIQELGLEAMQNAKMRKVLKENSLSLAGPIGVDAYFAECNARYGSYKTLLSIVGKTFTDDEQPSNYQI